ncbi:uncharacterized protein LOC134060255 isoform X2 [Sardina pilchardus]|uniref:uncharacterized protein LOC134060255 isoform X2 n=1 Tax=Sardina pilchardus TaxID=27697 RepID=UPI002E1178D4
MFLQTPDNKSTCAATSYTAAALTCYQCRNGISQVCPYIQTCVGICASITIVHRYQGIQVRASNDRKCISPRGCISGSINMGLYKSTLHTKCCNEDLCNDQIIPELNESYMPNGKECFTCVEGDCTKTLSCVGNEDGCITAHWFENTTKGCVSFDLCSAIKTHGDGIDTCCQGKLCNSDNGGHPTHDPLTTLSDDHDPDPQSDNPYHDPHTELNENNTPNGKECFTCIGGDCTKTLSCIGNEDGCITARQFGNITKGCVSFDQCLSMKKIQGNDIDTCCQGKLCNSDNGGHPTHDPLTTLSDDHDDPDPQSDNSYHDPHSDGHYDPHTGDHYYDDDPCEGIFCSSSKTVGQSVLLLLGSLLYLLLVH